MIDLYTFATPNGWKASCTLEELNIPYESHVIDITKGEQRSADYLAICPNGRIPAIIDRAAGNFAVFESGAIMIYLAEQAGALLPTEKKQRSRVLQWLMFQMGGVGPMQGQANVFYRYFPEKIPAAIDRYQNETKRLYQVLDNQLSKEEYLAGEFSLADIANWCWVRLHKWAGVNIDDLENLQRWMNLIEQRPACQKGIQVPFELKLSSDKEKESFVKEARDLLQR